MHEKIDALNKLGLNKWYVGVKPGLWTWALDCTSQCIIIEQHIIMIVYSMTVYSTQGPLAIGDQVRQTEG